MNGTTCSIKYISFWSEKENIILQWAFKLSSALATAQIWDLKGCVLKVLCGGSLWDASCHRSLSVMDFMLGPGLQALKMYSGYN
jgi:hypothetical protein